MNQVQNPPKTETVTAKTFKLKTGRYHLSFVCGHWVLRKMIDGKPSDKTELTNKSDEAIFRYLGDAERCTEEEGRSAYANAKATV